MNIPIFRSYELDTAFLIEGSYIKENGFYMNNTIPDYNKPVVRHKICDEDGIYHEVSKDYLAIHFPDMLDSQKNKIFASLSEDGKGGSLVVSKTYPFYGDAPEINSSSGKCEELNYSGLICFSSNGCYLDYVKVSDRVIGDAIGGLIEEFNEYQVIGIQK